MAARFSGGDPVPELEDISKASDERASWNSCKVNDASVRLPMSLSTAAALGEWPEKVMYYCSTHALKYTRSSQVASGGFSDVFLGLVHSTGSLVCLKQPALGYSESDIKAMEVFTPCIILCLVSSLAVTCGPATAHPVAHSHLYCLALSEASCTKTLANNCSDLFL